MRSHDHDAEGHGHGHSRSHVHKGVERRRLLASLALTSVMMLFELVGGLLSNSLALVSDAGHMATHFVALAITFFAIRIAAMPAPAERSYGFYRMEILAAFVNGVVLLGASAYILYEAVERLIEPRPIATLEMMVIAAAGLAVNLASVLLLAGVGKHDLNVKSAFFHMLGDTLSSVAVVGGAVVIYYTGWLRLDPALSALIAVLIAVWSLQLLRDSANVLLEATPRQVSIPALIEALRHAAPEVRDLHDLHVWEITSGMYALTAHVNVGPELTVGQLEQVREKLEACGRERFRIGHMIFQFESADVACRHIIVPFGQHHEHEPEHER